MINSESNREKISFALKFREKAQVLNQSIEVSIENTENSDKHKSEEWIVKNMTTIKEYKI